MDSDLLAMFKIPDIPPSSNHANAISIRRVRGKQIPIVYNTKRLKEWFKLVELSNEYRADDERIGKVYCSLILEFNMPLFYKNGNLRRVDTDDMIKYAQDGICKTLDFDDKFILAVYAVRTDSPTKSTLAYLYEHYI